MAGGLALLLAAALGSAPGSAATGPDGPRLAFLRFTERPASIAVATSDAALREPVTVAGGGRHARPFPYPLAGPAWSPDGSFVAFGGMSGPTSKLLLPGSRRIYLVEADGTGVRPIPGTRGGFGPVFSPDGQSIAFAKTIRKRLAPHGRPGRRWKGTTVWSVGLDGSGLRQLTDWANGVEDLPSSFSPGGAVLGLTHRDLFRDRADAMALRLDGRSSYVLARDASWPKYSPDGRRIAFLGIRRLGATSCCEQGDGFSVDLYTMDVDRSARRRLTDTPAKAERPASWDPSGERLAYTTKGTPTESSSGDLEASVMQVNADGSCPSRISVPIPRRAGYRVTFRWPTWRPGPGRGAGRIECFPSAIGSAGSGNGQLDSPADVEVDAGDGSILVADNDNHRIQRFNAKGGYLSQFGGKGSRNGQLDSPAAVAVDSKGNIWVGDSGNHRVQKFNSEGEFLLKCGSEGVGNGQFSRWGPKGIAVDSEDGIWVTDYSGRVQKFNESCKYLDEFGSRGTGRGQFVESAGIDIGPDGRIWVSEWKASHQVSVFSAAGEFLFRFGLPGSRTGQFKHPDGVEIDDGGNVWVLDEGNSRVQRFNQAGKYQDQFGSRGSGAGQFRFAWPGGLTSDGNGGVWVTDTGNNRIQRLPADAD
jgi:Tol biopolymer transport system component/sugar lactone lactonase YvrE